MTAVFTLGGGIRERGDQLPTEGRHQHDEGEVKSDMMKCILDEVGTQYLYLHVHEKLARLKLRASPPLGWEDAYFVASPRGPSFSSELPLSDLRVSVLEHSERISKRCRS